MTPASQRILVCFWIAAPWALESCKETEATTEDLTIVVASDRSEIEDQLAELTRHAADLDAERAALTRQRTELERQLASASGSPAREAVTANQQLVNLMESRTTELLVAIEAAHTREAKRALAEQLRNDLAAREEALAIRTAEQLRNHLDAREEDLATRTAEQVRSEIEAREELLAMRTAELTHSSVTAELVHVIGRIESRLDRIESRVGSLTVGQLTSMQRSPSKPADRPSRREPAAAAKKVTAVTGLRAGGPALKADEKKVEHIVSVEAAKGRLDTDAVAEALRLRRRGLEHCYAVEQRRNPELAGKVELAITVGKDGTVEKSKVRTNTTGSKRVGECMRASSRRWRFPSPDGGKLTVDVPVIIAAAR